MSRIPIIPDSLNFHNQSTILPYGNSLSNYTLALDEFVLFSLFFQFALVILGPERKRRSRVSLSFMIAVFYLYAIWVANYAMGLIPDKTVEGGRTGDLRVFWAPFLILHLGGPTGITVLSLADNELWLRYAVHLLTLSYTFGRVFLRNTYFLKNDLWVPTLMVFFAGALKYVERVTCLFCARLTKFRDSTLPTPDPGVDYAKIMHTYTSFKQSNIRAEFRISSTTSASVSAPSPSPAGSRTRLKEAQIVKKAYFFFRRFQGLVSSDWVIARVDQDSNSLSNRFLFAFLEKVLVLKGFLGSWGTCSSSSSPRRWSELIPQFNLISVRVDHNFASIVGIRLGLAAPLPWRNRVPKVRLSDKLQRFLFNELQARSNIAQQPRDVEELCSSRGMWALTILSRKHREASILRPWIADVEYEESLVLWHIATTLCYVNDDDPDVDSDGFRELSKILSEYLLHLLVMDPKMLPPSTKIRGWIIFRDTCGDADRFLRGVRPPHRPGVNNVLNRLNEPLSFEDYKWLSEACNKIIEVNTDLIPPSDVRGQESKSVLFDAAILAKKLQELDRISRWEVICKVWAEMLFYAAAHCRPNVHVQKLPIGGELLTLVWLLMVHIGLGKHFRHNKAKERRAQLVVPKCT